MTKFLPSAAAATTGIIAGSTIVATRFVIDQTSPASLALLRYSIACCCFLLPVLWSTRVPFERRDLLPMSLLGITQFGVVVTLLNYAVQFISSARAALLFAIFPLLTMILATAFGYERITLPKTLGILLTITGVGLTLGEKSVQLGGPTGGWVGELAVLAGALSGAFCSVLYRPYLKKYPTLSVSAFAMLASVIFLAVFAAGEGFFNTVPSFTAGGWLAVGFIGISSSINYYLWLWALNHTAPTNVTVFLALSPVTATILGALFLAERISPITLFGLICVVFGLWLAHWQAY